MTEERKNLIISDDSNTAADSHELDALFIRLKRLGKDKFQLDLYAKENFVAKIKASSHFFNMNLPEEYNEYFVSIEDAPLFWIMDSPIILFLEESIKQKEKDGGKSDLDPFKLIKEYYSKWVTTARKSEKKYFAQSLFKTISKEKKNNVISLIFGAMLFSFDEVMKNSEVAHSYFEQAELAANEIEDEKLKNELIYLFRLYSGFEFFQSNKIYEANLRFADACSLKPHCTSAKFYQALTDIMLHKTETGFDLLCDIYDYDISRLAFAINSNNFSLFQHFIKSPVFLNVFNYREFAIIYTLLEDYILGKEFGSNENLSKLRKKFEIFKELHLNEYQDPNVKNNFAFIEKILKGYFNSSLNFFFALSFILWSRFNDTMQLVFSSIRDRFLAEIHGQLKIYDDNINDLNNLILHLIKESEELKEKYKGKIKHSIAYYEQQYEAQMSFLDRKLTLGMEDSTNNPLNSFKSSLTYTFVFSALVMLVTGFASYSSSYSEEITGFDQIVKAIVLAGGKWGVVTLIVGFFISVASSVFAAYERSAEKQRIIKEISNLKYSKEKHIEKLVHDFEKSEKIALRNLTDRIENHKKRIKEVSNEKNSREIELNNQIEVKITEESEKLIELIEKNH
ncbi:MAG: hypothetical protein C0412_07675 [Flavobacterium sp.]|nr:hypothetical protein [Flavobacterium sp.]